MKRIDIGTMSLFFHEREQLFHLTNGRISYILSVMENGQLEQVYCGAALHDREGLGGRGDRTYRPLSSVNVPEPGTLVLQYALQEYPSYGTGDYRQPAFTLLQENGSRISAFVYQSYEVLADKPRTDPLPSTHASAGESMTLRLHLADEVSGTELLLDYTIFAGAAVLTRRATFTQVGEQAVTLERAMSLSVDLPDGHWDLLELPGAWARERRVVRRPLAAGITAVGGLNGTSSGPDYNPFIALLRPDAGERQGEVIGFTLLYSGNFLAQCEVTPFEQTRVSLGIHPQNFAWRLEQGESFVTPEAVMVFSGEGLGGMSRTFHHFFRDHLMRGKWARSPRPILINNWEATFMDFDEEKLLSIATRAKETGVELFVLDDGWFGRRNGEHDGLGDWTPNTDKLPDGIRGLSEKIEALGMKFGLWVELEMVNDGSDLYHEHPDWVIQTPGRFHSHGRFQYVLDFSRPEVVDNIYEQVYAVLSTAKISYIKWDMNRLMTEPYSLALAPERQGEFMHRYLLGVYSLYDRLTRAFPDILFESCASGGARFDPGMLYYAPQTWCSDDTDAIERTRIQYGTSMLYPLTTMGSHVSVVPNQQLGRTTPLATRADVAFFGTFGYELDLGELSEEEFSQVREQVQFMKKYRRLIQVDGEFYRLRSPFDGQETSWMVVSPERDQALILYVNLLARVNSPRTFLRLEGLDPDALYAISGDLTCRGYGDELMRAGIPISEELLREHGGDFAALLLVAERVAE